jgi:hypothetical protein
MSVFDSGWAIEATARSHPCRTLFHCSPSRLTIRHVGLVTHHTIGHNKLHEGDASPFIQQAFGVGRIEGVIWQVPEPVAPSEHRYKHR